MFKINVCRVCLSSDTDLYNITNTNYEEIYEKLTSTKLEDCLPKSLCCICYSQLKKCMKFAEKALKSYKILLEWSHCGTVVTNSMLSTLKSPHPLMRTSINVLSIDSETRTKQEMDIKQEVTNTQEVADLQILKNTKDSLNYHSLFLNDKSLNNTSSPDEMPSLLRHLLISSKKILNDRVTNDKSMNDKFSNDNSSNDRIKSDNSLNDRTSNDKLSNDTGIPNDDPLNKYYEVPVLNNFIVLSEKSRNDNVLNDKLLNDIRLINDNEPSDNLLNDHFSSSDDEFLSSLKPMMQANGPIKDQFKKLNVTVVKVDIDQQRRDMASRIESENYIHSEYKCNFCFKGFCTLKTFTKHMYKHSEEKSGKYECDLCHYRYRTISQLKIHIENTHSRFYKCNICGVMLHSFFQAKIHNREHEGLKYACELCSKEFKKRTSYLSHVRIKHTSKHICKVCGKGFISGLGLLQHMSKAHRGDTIRQESYIDCNECDLQFVCKDALYRHRLDSSIHRASWTHNSTICFVCNDDLKNNMLLKKHIKEHRDILFYNHNRDTLVKNIMFLKCDQCSKVFTQKSNLRVHVKKKHLSFQLNCRVDGKLNNEDFICEICGAKLKSKASLTSHSRTHTDERPYLCNTCSKSFHDRKQLNLHVRIHTGYRPYQCGQCSKKFTQKTALNRHMRTHTGAKPYTCPVCTKQFSQSNSLKGHVSTVHYKLPSYKQRMKEKNKMADKDSEINV